MLQFLRPLRLVLMGFVIVTTFSCSDQNTRDVTGPQTTRTLPETIDYFSLGTLSNYVYRSTFAYDDANRLLSVTDKLLTAQNGSISNAPAKWVDFEYTNNSLSMINLAFISYDPDKLPAMPTDGDIKPKPASFALSHSGKTLNARLLVSGQEVNNVSFSLDDRGFPVRANANLGKLFFDGAGNVDYILGEKKRKEANPAYRTEVLEQRYDTAKNVFADCKEMQILEALLALTNRDIIGRGIVGLGNFMSTNNLVYRKWRSCDPAQGCYEWEEKSSETQALNAYNFPTKRICQAGPLGQFQFDISYKRID